MDTVRSVGHRRVTAAFVVAAIALAVALTVQGAAPVAGAPHHHAAARHAKAQALHDGMRKLWEDHITWTRLAIVSFAHDLPDLSQTEARLLRNQTDIGNAVKPYYGRRAGNQLTALLKEHITEAVDLLAAAKSGDAARIEAARSAWYDNANRIAAFLHTANPRFWPLGVMRTMMREHLDETLDEAVARLEGRYADDIRAYERVHGHILMMADTLTRGIVRQFPRRFR
jgi:hypothetical protein